MSFVWSRESRYYNPLCTNSLRAESGNTSELCEACVIPVDPGTCEFVWDDPNQKWVASTDDCGSGFTAVEPDTPGTSDGETRAGTCTR